MTVSGISLRNTPATGSELFGRASLNDQSAHNRSKNRLPCDMCDGSRILLTRGATRWYACCFLKSGQVDYIDKYERASIKGIKSLKGLSQEYWPEYRHQSPSVHVPTEKALKKNYIRI